MVPAAGLEPARPGEDFGFKDRCVYHSTIRARYDRSGKRVACQFDSRPQEAEKWGKIVDKSILEADSAPDKGEASQRSKFEEAARAAECDEDEARWDERLRKVAKQKPNQSQSSDS